MTWLPLTEPLFRSIASLIERIASAKRENGELITAQNTSRSREIILLAIEVAVQIFIRKQRLGASGRALLPAFQRRHEGNTRDLQRTLDLSAGKERIVHQLPTYPGCYSEY